MSLKKQYMATTVKTKHTQTYTEALFKYTGQIVPTSCTNQGVDQLLRPSPCSGKSSIPDNNCLNYFQKYKQEHDTLTYTLLALRRHKTTLAHASHLCAGSSVAFFAQNAPDRNDASSCFSQLV